MLDLSELFNRLHSEKYCVFKKSEMFPEYNEGDDVDIFCLDPAAFSQQVLAWANPYATGEMTLEVHAPEEYNIVTIDMMHAKHIHFRVECYGEMPKYKRLHIKPALFQSIIENRTQIEYQSQGKTHKLMIPDLIDEMVLRYIEFIEWYHVRPDKVAHLDYILKKMDDANKIMFLDKLHHYTRLPQHAGKPKGGSLSQWLKKLFK